MLKFCMASCAVVVLTLGEIIREDGEAACNIYYRLSLDTYFALDVYLGISTMITRLLPHVETPTRVQRHPRVEAFFFFTCRRALCVVSIISATFVDLPLTSEAFARFTSP